jgi:ABC-type multidrug transport system fused ATPase/permease subunit
MAYLKQILYLLGPDRRRLPALGAAVLFGSALDTIGIGLIGPFVAIVARPELMDAYPIREWAGRLFGVTRTESVVLVFGIALVLLFCVKACVILGTQFLVARFVRLQQIRLRSTLLQAYQAMPYEQHLLGDSAEAIQVILAYVSTYCGPCLWTLMRLVAEGCVALALLAIIAWTDWVSVAVLLCVLGAVGLLHDRLFRRKARAIGMEAAESNLEMVRGVQQALEGLKEVRVLGREASFHERVVEGARRYARVTAQHELINAMPRYVTETALLTFVIGVILVAQAQDKGLESVAPFLAMVGLAGLRILPLNNLLLSGIGQLRVARYPVDCLYRAMRRAEEMGPAAHATAPARERPEFEVLELKNVSYRYPNAVPWALEGVSMTVRRGEAIGIVGASGAGKTTALDVLLGLLEPQEGDVLMNGRSVTSDPRAWLDRVGYLPQMVFLIDDTLRANVALGVPPAEIDDERVRLALQRARLGELVDQLPEGMGTKLGERGMRLSGGQRQRVALARAFYHERDVLVLDEATSALDTETERQIVEEIRHLRGTRTLVVIAHRLSTVQHCDRIYRLDRGRAVQSGTFDEVIPGTAHT